MKMRIVNIRVVTAAFTLIELLLVLVILAVLAASSCRSSPAAGRGAQDHGREGHDLDHRRRRSTRSRSTTAATRPTRKGSGRLRRTSRRDVTRTGTGPYIKTACRTTRGATPYVYRYPGTHNANGYDLYSLGPDGREGNDDITNWTQK